MGLAVLNYHCITFAVVVYVQAIHKQRSVSVRHNELEKIPDYILSNIPFICKLLLENCLFSDMTKLSGFPCSGKNIRKIKFFSGQGKVGEFCGYPGKRLGKSGKRQGN